MENNNIEENIIINNNKNIDKNYLEGKKELICEKEINSDDILKNEINKNKNNENNINVYTCNDKTNITKVNNNNNQVLLSKEEKSIKNSDIKIDCEINNEENKVNPTDIDINLKS